MKKYKNKLRYRSWHRGTKEADLFLGKFFDNYINKMSQEDLIKYEEFLDEFNDNDILLIIQGHKNWSTKLPTRIVKLLQEFIKNENFR
ncbi:MAG: hypothetical protein CFH34_01217 [Alphaproteobacteria bacterium MarineAlpha9_Bin4]|nr:succinate dehydrogenase assembly factor 2 [Pelagibacterales bacterium]PPR25922.1 MAG: hypothetical protein CFH34_01217 [Alphaproteobacteria bacterium MarineAlpha9_Bin4]|tara:strand:+ start:189 stop:452 length:264 start_codon:yes stop_codon:yes gene_type:complete